MGVEVMDRSLAHLFPSFRGNIRAILSELADATGEPWTVVEGYRSSARQLWLYASGRTRPGPKVTWMRSPTYHGTGLAADLAPVRVLSRGYKGIPRSHWETYRLLYSRGKFGTSGTQALTNPAWGKGDLQHVQDPHPRTRLQALEWVRAGFRDEVLHLHTLDPGASRPWGVRVFVCGEESPGSQTEIRDAAGFLEEDRVWLWSRPVLDALGWTITAVKGGRAQAARDKGDDFLPGASSEASFPLRFRGVGVASRGFVRAADLSPLASAFYNAGSRTLYLAENPADLPSLRPGAREP